MSNTVNVTLNVVATGLIAMGVTTVATHIWTGLAEIIVGVICYVVYEVVPTAPTAAAITK